MSGLLGDGPYVGMYWPLTSGGPLPAIGANVAYPDTSAIYWVTPFTQDQALRITVKGQFPDARYMSINVYDASLSSFTSASGVASGLADYKMAADAGSLNPWQVHAPAGGRFTVDIRADAAPGMVNTLPMPSGGSFDGAFPVPCQGDQCPTQNVFLRASLGGLFPNVDNAYVSALITPKSGQVYVITGKLPNAVPPSNDTHPMPWPMVWSEGSVQLRYWSICSNVYVQPFPVVGCLRDHAVKTDANGRYTIVASTILDRPANANTSQGMNWLQLAQRPGATRQMLIVRNMLPNDFEQAAQDVPTTDKLPPGTKPEDAARQVMGDYDPQVRVCSKASFEALGPTACTP